MVSYLIDDCNTKLQVGEVISLRSSCITLNSLDYATKSCKRAHMQ